MTTGNGLLQRVPESLRSTVALVVTDEGCPQRPLLSLVNVHRLEHSGSFASIVKVTQKAWNGAVLKAGELPQESTFSHYVRRQTIYYLNAFGQLPNSQVQPDEPWPLTVRLRGCAQFLRMVLNYYSDRM